MLNWLLYRDLGDGPVSAPGRSGTRETVTWAVPLDIGLWGDLQRGQNTIDKDFAEHEQVGEAQGPHQLCGKIPRIEESQGQQ